MDKIEVLVLIKKLREINKNKDKYKTNNMKKYGPMI
jgi:hypothetical protein